MVCCPAVPDDSATCTPKLNQRQDCVGCQVAAAVAATTTAGASGAAAIAAAAAAAAHL
jgi:hypothetical protein